MGFPKTTVDLSRSVRFSRSVVPSQSTGNAVFSNVFFALVLRCFSSGT